ncbi:MAG: hypothetical protein A4E35_00897 [Methanoregula sp. PtaU1.Bin051]|nr:MAG: hypothetical protein A4E35_00897 [Methanoregula sp. PtaU1.Bin051]
MTSCRFLCCMLCIAFLITAGCTSLAIGEVTSSQDHLTVHIVNSGNPVTAGLQVRTYEIRNMEQRELTNTVVTAMLEKGENSVAVPLHLEPGTYKLYIYLTINNERKTASIKDVVV